jgi:hypothetical protein
VACVNLVETTERYRRFNDLLAQALDPRTTPDARRHLVCAMRAMAADLKADRLWKDLQK